MKWQVKVFCFGMLSEVHKFDTEEEAKVFAAEMWRIPGMIPIVSWVD